MIPEENQQLYPDAAQRIMTLMKATFGARGHVFNSFFLGLPDNLVIPQAAFPCMIVDKTDGKFKVSATGTDDITEQVVIHILADIKSGFGRPDTDNPVKRQLQTYVEGRDPATGALLPQTVMYALRRYLTLQSTTVPNLPTINNDVEVQYSPQARPDMPETREAIITITVYERQVLGVRS